MSTFKQDLLKEIKNKRISEMPEEKRKEMRTTTLENILSDITDKKNRYVFYVPDIAVVNPLVKLVYETAYQVQQAGYTVVILHEMNGFKAKWLFDCEGYEHFRSMPIEYVMSKKAGSKKTKKTSNKYSFRVSDTLVVTDAYQDMLENIMQEDSMRLLQKIVLVTGYMGLSAIRPGTNYEQLGVSSLVFFDDNIKDDYSKLFQTKSYIVDNYPLSQAFVGESIIPANVAPSIAVSSIGNNEQAQQLINVFYNRYPNLSMFTFNVLPRENMEVYADNIKTSAAVVILDKNVVTKQSIYEILNMGIPVVLPHRREYMDNKVLVENFLVTDDIFEMADEIAKFCQFWLVNSTTKVNEDMLAIAKELELESRTQASFGATVAGIFHDFQDNRVQTFENMLKSIENG